MPSNWVFWVVFNAFVVAMLVLDLGVFHRRSRVVRFKEAIAWTFFWDLGRRGWDVLSGEK
ncbi:MAG: hypothetical protein ACLPXM_08820 [Terriglobales bacterium]